MHKCVGTGAVLGSMLLLSGCTNLLTGAELVRAGEPVGSIKVVNNSNYTLNTVLIYNCDASSYGPDRLPDGAEIAHGQSATFTVSAGCWDVIGSTAGVADAIKRMDVTAGSTTQYTIGPSE
ncbi:MAG: hypothetical protein ACSHYC_00020 [Alphaproteobacteria bacterium]